MFSLTAHRTPSYHSSAASTSTARHHPSVSHLVDAEMASLEAEHDPDFDEDEAGLDGRGGGKRVTGPGEVITSASAFMR